MGTKMPDILSARRWIGAFEPWASSTTLISTDEAIERWNEHAEAFTAGYTEEGDRSRRILLNPAIFSLLGHVEGTEILDAGCGEGYLSRLLERKGAHVTAVDYSTEMLKLAEAKAPESSGIHYHHGNCEKMPQRN